MKTLKHLIITIAVNWLLLYIISKYIPEAWLKIVSEYSDQIVIFWFLWLVFRITNGIIKKILNIVTIPLKLVTLWLSSIVLNVLMFYFFEQFINYLDVWIQVQLWNIIQVVILSVFMTLSYFLIKKII